MKCIAIELLTEIRDRLRNLDTLEVKRAVKAAQQARYRARKRAVATTAVDTTSNVDTTKEDEKGKESFPPSPPIEKRAKAEENNNHDNRVRAREASAACSQRPTVEEVAAFVREIKSDVDPAYFWRYYNSNHRRWPREWRDRLRNWTVNGIPRGRIDPDAARAPAPVAEKPADWTLCAERCANCNGEGCACGVKVPPACEERPRPPEECPQFKKAKV